MLIICVTLNFILFSFLFFCPVFCVLCCVGAWLGDLCVLQPTAFCTHTLCRAARLSSSLSFWSRLHSHLHHHSSLCCNSETYTLPSSSSYRPPPVRFLITLFSASCSSSSLARGYVTRASTFTSSISTEELTPDHTSLDSVADSGRGSWTSCSSNSHDSFQSLPTSSCRPWDHGIHGHPHALPLPHTHLGGFKHTQLAGAIAEVEAGQAWAKEDAAKRHSRGSSSELSNQSRQSWASSSSLSDTYEGNYGTIKRRNTSEHPSSPTNEEGGQSTDPAYKTVTSSTEKGLIGEGPGGEFDSLWARCSVWACL